MKLTIYGPPIAKQRHRCACVGRRRNHPKAIDLQGHTKKAIQFQMKQAIKKAFASESKEIVMKASELAQVASFDVTLTFLFPIPKSLTRAQKNAKLWGMVTNTDKPDLDNLEKMYLDCLSKVFWNDDSEVVCLQSKKYYSENPRTEIEIMAKKGIAVAPNVESALKTISPTELREFLEDVREFLQWAPERVDELLPQSEEAHVAEEINNIAYALISFADKYSDKLKKIAKIGKI